MDTLEATIRIVFSTADDERAREVLGRIISNIEWSSDIIEDVFVEDPPTPAGE